MCYLGFYDLKPKPRLINEKFIADSRKCKSKINVARDLLLRANGKKQLIVFQKNLKFLLKNCLGNYAKHSLKIMI